MLSLTAQTGLTFAVFLLQPPVVLLLHVCSTTARIFYYLFFLHCAVSKPVTFVFLENFALGRSLCSKSLFSGMHFSQASVWPMSSLPSLPAKYHPLNRVYWGSVTLSSYPDIRALHFPSHFNIFAIVHKTFSHSI